MPLSEWMDGRRAPEDIQADVESAREILANALDEPRDQVEEDAAIMVAAGSWWIEDLLAMPAAAWLLGHPARELLQKLNVPPDDFISADGREFRDKLAEELPVLLDEAGFRRLRSHTDPRRRLLLRLLGIVWKLATGRAVAGGDRDDGPLARFLEAMVTGLPGLARTPAARSAHCLSARVMLREARGPRRR
jgi:hypothetical protein